MRWPDSEMKPAWISERRAIKVSTLRLSTRANRGGQQAVGNICSTRAVNCCPSLARRKSSIFGPRLASSVGQVESSDLRVSPWV